MGAKTTTALVTAAALAAALAVATPILAQTRTAAQVTLTEGDAPYAVTILGPVRAEIHQKSMFPKTPARQLANEELQKQAARLGADAVVKIVYENSNAMTSKKGFVATGVAVRYQAAPQQFAAAPAPAPVAAPSVAAPVATAPAAAPVYAPHATPASAITLSEQGIGAQYTRVQEITVEVHQKSLFPSNSARKQLDEQLRQRAAALGADAVINITYDINNAMFSKKGQVAKGTAVKFVYDGAAPPPAVAQAAPPQQYAAAPAPSYAPAPALAAPRVGPTPAAAITISEQDIGTRYTRLQEITAEVHQKSMFPSQGARKQLEEQLRQKAAALGADAVISVTYDINNAMFSKKGQHAKGVAVRFVHDGAAPVAAAPAAYAAAPAPAYAPAPAAAYAAPRVGPTPMEAITISEQGIAARYANVRQISVVHHQKSMFPKESSKNALDRLLREQAARAGADAVINVKYDLSNAMFSKDGQRATGLAVKFVYDTPAAPGGATPTPIAAVAAAPAAPVQIAAASSTGPTVTPPPPPNYTARAPRPAPAPPRTTLPPYPTPTVLPPGVTRPAAAAAVLAAAPRTSAAEITLSEADVAGRTYVKLGDVRAEAHQSSMFPGKSTRALLDESLRAQAESLGADAVVLIKYDMKNPMFSKDSSKAVGAAVKFQ